MTPVSEESWRAHCHAVLDGEATAQQAAQVGAEIALRPDRAREFARLAMLHDALQRAAIAGEAGRSAARRVRTMSLVRRLVLAAAALALACARAPLPSLAPSHAAPLPSSRAASSSRRCPPRSSSPRSSSPCA